MAKQSNGSTQGHIFLTPWTYSNKKAKCTGYIPKHPCTEIIYN